MSFFIWLVIAAVMALVEVLSFGLITVWFVLGALVSFVATLLGAGLLVQCIVFLAVSLVCLVALRPVIVKYRKHGQQHESSVIGQNAVVIERIDNDLLTGRIETPDHMSWAARSANGVPIEIGEKVKVIGQESIKLVVERV